MTSTTAILGANTAGYRGVSHLSNTFAKASNTFSLASIAPVLRSELRVTLRDTSGLGFASAVTVYTSDNGADPVVNASNTAISMKNVANTGDTLAPFLLVDGISIVGAAANTSSGTSDQTATTYFVAAGAAAGTQSISVAGVTAIATDRSGWL